MEEKHQGASSTLITETEIVHWNRHAVRRGAREFAIEFAADENAIERFAKVVNGVSVEALKERIILKEAVKRPALIAQLKNVLNMLWDAAPIVEYEELFKGGNYHIEERLIHSPEWRKEISKALAYIEKEQESIQADSSKNGASATRKPGLIKWLGSREEFQKLCEGLVPALVSKESLCYGVLRGFDFPGGETFNNRTGEPIHWKGSRKQLARLYSLLVDRNLIRESRGDFLAAFAYFDRKTTQWRNYDKHSFEVGMSEMQWMDTKDVKLKLVDAAVNQL
jgi:hypothetical protein